MSETFGRRSVYIIAGVISFGSSIWRAKATTYASFMGASVLNGISAGPGEVRDKMQTNGVPRANALQFTRRFNQLYLQMSSFCTSAEGKAPYTLRSTSQP